MRTTHHNIPKGNKNRRRSSVPVVKNARVVKHHKGGKSKQKSNAKHNGGKSFMAFMSSDGMIKVYGLLLVAFALLLLVSVGSYIFTHEYDIAHVTDQALPPHNLARSPGAHIAHFFTDYTFGFASLGFVLLFFLYGLQLIGITLKRHETPISIFKISITTLLTMSWLSFATGLFVFNTPYEYLSGSFGLFTSQALLNATGKLVTALITIVTALILLILCYQMSIKNLFIAIGGGMAAIWTAIVSAIKKRKSENNDKSGSDNKKTPDSTKSPDENQLANEKNDPYISDLNGWQSGINGDNTIHFPNEEENEEDKETDEPTPWDTKPEENPDDNSDVEFEVITNPANDNNETGNDEDDEADEEQENTEPHELTAEDVRNLEPYDPRKDLSTYQFPPIDCLDPHTSATISPEAQRKELTETKIRIENTLKSFKIGITKISAIIGPTVTLYEIVPEEGVRISRIKSLEDDIALSLSALGIRIIAPIPGKGTIGIEVPNKVPTIVSMREIIASDKFQNNKYDLPIGLGKTISNEPFVCDLAKMPHLLMAGATGQGKSVGLNAVITSLLYSKHPSELKFVLVDPKKLEFNLYAIIEKHFLAKLPDEEEAIIIDTKKVIRTLNSLCIEMDTRYDLLKAAKVRNIKEYNAKFCRRELSPANGHRYLPYIVLIIDEFGDLIMTAGREVEHPIARLAQLARACGIHLIIATQRPTVKIISGNIKGNFPARIAFRVVARIDSQTILDATGADQLVGKGDMLLSTGSDLLRLQCAFVDTPEVEAITSFIADQQSYESAFMLPEYADDNDEAANEEFADNGKIDSCFMDAATLIVQSQQGSTSLIQRKMNLGYNRAGRIMDQMEKFGIVGPSNGSKAREVKVQTMEELRVIFSKMGLI
ncbi:MAG: DNA translocase FtsK 4TM domain-containing protein [Bacteroidales bacterium]|nr:DNA translocase FtsK 4TM domain-containing protein [Bacteroidales bacterium]